MLQLPDHVTEAEVLALIEGDLGSLPAERRDVVREAVARDPALSQIVREIKADSSAVVSFSRIAAPAVIRARVIEDLRRPTPAPDRIREPTGGQIPVSTVIVTTERPWRTVAHRLPVRRFAAAASLLLAAGIGVWIIGKAINIGVEHARTAALATADDTAPPPSEFSVPTSTHPPDAINPTALAGATTDPPEDGIPASTDNLALPGNPQTPPSQLAADEPLLGTPQTISPESAIELARAGRLVIRVRALNEADAQHDIDQFAVRTAEDLKWRPLEAWELPQVTLALRDRAPKAIPYASERPPGPIRANASDAPRPSSLPPVEPLGVAADIADALKEADFRPLYTVEMDENERDLAALLQRLSKSKSHIAEFIALEEPLPTLIPSTDPNAVLWWSRPPGDWTRRVCVPIVLESHP